MTFIRTRLLYGMLALAWLLGTGVTPGAPIDNAASGSVVGRPLGPSTVTLNRATGAVSSALAEIAPNTVLVATVGDAFTYDVLPTINPGNTGIQQLDITVPAGYTNLAMTAVTVGGTPLAASCPTPGASQYCATESGGVITILLGDHVTLDQTRIRVDFNCDTPAGRGTADFPSTVTDGITGIIGTFAGNADGDPADDNSITVDVVQNQGLVLDLQKVVSKREVLIGEAVGYAIAIGNTTVQDVLGVRVDDMIPPNFKYVQGTTRLDGAPLADPTGNRTLIFDIGTVPALVDGNGNNQADPGEPGYLVLTYQLMVGSGATPGDYTNTAVAKDFCDTCEISSTTTANVRVPLDPLFDLGTIIGKVFQDRNRNDWQDPDEPGVPDAMVALDDGTYALTDEYGKYHFPAVKPGHRMLKLNMNSLPPGTEVATEVSHIEWITPGLMAKVNFGVLLRHDTERIGKAAETALTLTSEERNVPLKVQGSTESGTALLNGREIPLPGSDVTLRAGRAIDSVQIAGDRLESPVRFRLDVNARSTIESWSLVVFDQAGEVVRRLDGSDELPEATEWDGMAAEGQGLVAGRIYQYQLDVRFADGSTASSPRRLFGVNRTSVVSLDLHGSAFEFNKAALSEEAKRALVQAVAVLAKHPGEKVVIEGHTDSIGTREYNMDLSRRRAEAAASYLIDDLGLPAERFAVHWYGEDRPRATNDLDEGRALNRRVEIAGEIEQREDVAVVDRYRADPWVRINGSDLAVGEHGRFATELGDEADGIVEIEMADSEGRSVKTSVAVPHIEITSPPARLLVRNGSTAGGCSALEQSGESRLPDVACRVAGRTEPGNVVELAGQPLTTDPDGRFEAALTLELGRNVYGLVVRNPEGFSRLANLEIQVADRDENGDLLLVTEEVPFLSLDLPPQGVRLTSTRLRLNGFTAPDNRVTINDRPFEVAADGSFSDTIELPRGESRIVARVTNPAGREATIERDVEVSMNELFLLAFADGKFGQLKGSGYIEGAGLDERDDYYTEGRLAFYLKGVISGKYLITAAFDSGYDEVDKLFNDLDGEASQQLLTNLDPDKFYPVYGDASTVVYDVESQGKFYLSLDSDEISALVGNYPLTLDQTELSAYRRTLYGARFAYQSASRTRYGDANTQVVLFAADVRQVHVEDEMRATGGSIYYLSHRDVVEGSEEVTLIVRDMNTGLTLMQLPQRQNLDYTVKYEEGRILFKRPISSVIGSTSIVNQQVLAGNPVFIHADYETLIEEFEKTGAGGRVRQQIGDHVAVGVTRIEDERSGSSYELSGVDAEVRLGRNSRLTAEFADSSGAEGLVFISNDGGLTYTAAPSTGNQEGSAWKAGVELDIGEWFGKPDRYEVKAYFKELDPGFVSSGTFMEQGTRKIGVQAQAKLTGSDSIRIGYDEEQRTGGGPSPALGETRLTSAQWHHEQKRWGVMAGFLDTETEDAMGVSLNSSSLGSVRFWSHLTEQFSLHAERQQTLSGTTNDQTTLGLKYQILENLALDLSGTDATSGQSAQLGATLTRGDSSFYISERLDAAQAGDKTTTILGARAPIGRNSRVYSEYQWERSDAGDNGVSLLGLQRQWEPAEGLRVTLSGELSDVSGTTDQRRSAISTGLSYSNADDLKASTRQEVRYEDGTTRRTQFLTINQLDYQLNTDFSLLVRYRYSKTRDRDQDTTDARFEEMSVGVAYRPVKSDRFNSLARFTRLADLRPASLPTIMPTDRVMSVFSIETSFDINKRIEWVAKGAARLMEQRDSGLPPVDTETYLAIQRFNFNLWKPIDLGVEYRTLAQRTADDRRMGFLGELTYDVFQQFRVGVGYNFTDFTDDEFSQNDYSVHGWFFRIQGRY